MVSHQLPPPESPTKRPTSAKSHQSPPSWAEERDDIDIDIEMEDGQWDGTTTANNIRSRVKGRHSPTQSDDDNDRLPLIHRLDSSDSDDFADTSTNNNHSSTTPLQWARLAALAFFLTHFVYYIPAIFLSVAYFPTGNRMWYGGLADLTSTPVLNYEAAPQRIGESEAIHIPRIVHVTYKSREELPEEWKLSIQQWEAIHPHWELRFWSDKDIEEFVHNTYPEMEALHKSYKFMIQRVDSVRYMILHHFGGVYSDMDIYPATNLDKLLQQWEDAGKNVLLAESFNMGVTNAFMASAPQSSFMACVIDNLPRYQHAFHHVIHWQHWEVLSSAGSNYLWGMVGHCEDPGVEIMAASSFRGCSVCNSWETGQPADSCDTEWLHHSSTNSSWHQHGNYFHALLIFVSYSFLCRPFRACFVSVTAMLILLHRRKMSRRRLDKS